jgi:hypothetical protein
MNFALELFQLLPTNVEDQSCDLLSLGVFFFLALAIMVQTERKERN